MSFIEVNNISKAYRINKRGKGIPGMVANLFVPKYEKKQAVKEVSFQIEKGDMVGFIGPNGAGKSTTIKMLSGILHPDSGDIKVNGFVPYKQRKDYVGSIGVVFGQRSQLQWDLPVIDSFELLKAIYRVPQEKYEKNLNRFVEMLDMGGFLQQPVRQLSLGQRMRADIVAALLHSPEIVFFDEPTIGVDVVGKETIRNFIKELNQEYKVTMLFTTHDIKDIEKVCDKLIVIDKGEKIYDGSLLGIREKYGTTRQLDVEFAGREQVAPIANVEQVELDELDGRKKRFVFENKQVQINELVKFLLQNYRVKDISISEPEIESIIRKIYNGEVVPS
ncbi:MAG: ATP-binding cassette domain-containing protein [Lachnospiraceae bacterium]|nr:ATP-binding cassette domain-containing protein [Lachnospiraceae bacterium]